MTAHPLLPDFLTLEARLRAADLSAALRAVLRWASAARMAAPAKWAIPLDSGARGGDLPAHLDAGGTAGHESAELWLGDGTLGAVSRMDGDWLAAFNFATPSSPGVVVAQLAAGHAFCRAALADGALAGASLRRQGNGADFLPEVPVAGGQTHLVAASRAEVEEAYEDADAFFAAGWDARDEGGGCVLLARALGASGSAGFAAAVQSSQWALARAARPRRTSYYAPRPLPGEEAVFHAGAPVLHAVGYAPVEQVLEFAAAPAPGEHVCGWEVYALADVVRRGATEDGRPVRTVRVVFADGETARAERRPLLDNGVRVFVDDGTGALREVPE